MIQYSSDGRWATKTLEKCVECIDKIECFSTANLLWCNIDENEFEQ